MKPRGSNSLLLSALLLAGSLGAESPQLGKERQEEEYRDLLATGGFELSQVVPTASDVSLMVARKA